MNRDASKTAPAKDFWSWDSRWKRKLLAVCAGFCICGIVFAVMAQQMINRGERSLRWPAAEGTVVRSTIVPVVERNRQGRETRQYMAASIECVYEAKGRKLEYSWQESVNIFAVIAKYPVGRKLTIYYDPESEDATLHPGVRDADRSMRLWSALAAALGAMILVPLLRKMWRTPTRSPH